MYGICVPRLHVWRCCKPSLVVPAYRTGQFGAEGVSGVEVSEERVFSDRAVGMACDASVMLDLALQRASDSIVIYRSARTGRRQCSIVTLHAGNDVHVSRVQPPTTPCSVGWSQIAPPHEPMSRTGLLKKRLSTSLLPIKVAIHYPSPTTQPSPPAASSIAARIARATGPFRPGGNEAPRRVSDVLFLKPIARGVAPAFAQCVEDV